ncbi:MAG: hypothetical protein DRP00_03465 [Candidatus Aenigmatarchaeota archaeon]|nr:MAG: hypothetical protein DRP00_03465 [Candidatus Aenigmarchaeota archaeon]
MHKLYLTFDVEDFINSSAIYALYCILKILEKYHLKGIFFITGHMAEKLSNYPEIIELLKNHKIGFHSSSHSVRPIIPEYTDVKSYKEAYEISRIRETSHINPITGKIEKEGGIYVLHELFHPKKIEAYRAPGMCWTPPHLEALRDLGIRYDFSTNITHSEPVIYKKIIFYPPTFIQHWDGTLYNYECLATTLIKHKVSIFDLHPALYVNQKEWDSIYFNGNPQKLQKTPQRPIKEAKSLFVRFELFIKLIKFLQKNKIIEVTNDLNTPQTSKFVTNRSNVENYYKTSMQWPNERFNYRPKFIRKHFYDFFEEAC